MYFPLLSVLSAWANNAAREFLCRRHQTHECSIVLREARRLFVMLSQIDINA